MEKQKCSEWHDYILIDETYASLTEKKERSANEMSKSIINLR